MKDHQGPPAPEGIACGCDGSLKNLPFISYVLLSGERLQERLGWDARGSRGGGRASASEELLPLPAFPSPCCSPHRGSPLQRDGRHTAHTGVISARQREERERGRRGTASCMARPAAGRWGTLTWEQSQVSLAPAARPQLSLYSRQERIPSNRSHQGASTLPASLLAKGTPLQRISPAPRHGARVTPAPAAMPPEHRPPEGWRGTPSRDQQCGSPPTGVCTDAPKDIS